MLFVTCGELSRRLVLLLSAHLSKSIERNGLEPFSSFLVFLNDSSIVLEKLPEPLLDDFLSLIFLCATSWSFIALVLVSLIAFSEAFSSISLRLSEPVLMISLIEDLTSFILKENNFFFILK